MNFSKPLLAAIGVSLAALSFSSCDTGNSNTVIQPFYYTYTFENLSASLFNDQGVYDGVYTSDTETKGYILYPDLFMSHDAGAEEYDGYEYKWWNGFTFSRSTDNADHDGDYNYQWGAITGFGVSASAIYGLAFWDTQESLTSIPERPSCLLSFSVYVQPQSICVTNSAYAYYAMLNGTYFNRKFTDSDYLNLIIKGVKDGQITNEIKVPLAADGTILSSWKMVDLTPLGVCSNIYFQMESSDSGQYGMNVPSYFCFDDICIYYGNDK